MSRAPPENFNTTEADAGPGICFAWISSTFRLTLRPIDNRQYPSQSVPNQTPRETSDFIDGSGPIFSMYLEMATEEDKKKVEDWKADADGILIFVRLYLLIPCLMLTPLAIDRFILRCRCVVDLSVHPGHSAELTRHFQLLSRKYISDSRPQSIHFDFPPIFPASVHSAKSCHLGQLALVPEFGDQYHLRATRDIATTVGAKIPQGHSTALQPTQESAHPILLF